MKFSIQHTLEVLEKTPNVLHTLLLNLSVDWIICNEGENTWSAFDIVGHLIHGEKTDWIPRMQIILSDSQNKTFETFDRFAQFENSKGKTLLELLNEFSELRQQNLTYLKSLNLTEDQWDLEGTHPELGTVTLKQLLATWVVHDLTHIAQLSRVMAKQYKNEVGPWKAFLPLLNT
ncbi:DinB family protein [Flavobacteriaceae bacterium MAR_2010_72]|nr:DinB family protein [Flavobacteriaceae bacterium MAR_2010_72]TVZ58157.1 DinB family protein [Flavobacteriaceae bacterium MAR_2010_105]